MMRQLVYLCVLCIYRVRDMCMQIHFDMQVSSPKNSSFSNQNDCLYHYKTHLKTRFMVLNYIDRRSFHHRSYFISHEELHIAIGIKVHNSFRQISQMFPLEMKKLHMNKIFSMAIIFHGC